MKIISYYNYKKTLNFCKNKTIALLLAMRCPFTGKKHVAGEMRFGFSPYLPPVPHAFRQCANVSQYLSPRTCSYNEDENTSILENQFYHLFSTTLKFVTMSKPFIFIIKDKISSKINKCSA